MGERLPGAEHAGGGPSHAFSVEAQARGRGFKVSYRYVVSCYRKHRALSVKGKKIIYSHSSSVSWALMGLPSIHFAKI